VNFCVFYNVVASIPGRQRCFVVDKNCGLTSVAQRFRVCLERGAAHDKACNKGYKKYIQCLGRCLLNFGVFDDLITNIPGRPRCFCGQQWWSDQHSSTVWCLLEKWRSKKERLLQGLQ
jgi:hypothetical protein